MYTNIQPSNALQVTYHDFIRLIVPTAYDLRELFTICSVIPATVVAPNRVYPVRFNLDNVIRETVVIAAAAKLKPHAIQTYIMNLQAESLYLIDPDIQQRICVGLTNYIVRLMEIFTMQNLYESNGSFHWKFHEFNPNTYNITLIRERPNVQHH